MRMKTGLIKQTISSMSNETFISLFMISVLVVLYGIACLIVPNFYLPVNILNFFLNYWFIIILGIGVTFLLVTGNFDMSVGGVVAMTGVLAVYFSQSSASLKNPLAVGLGLPYGFAIILALICALAVGGVNAFFIVKLKVPSIIVTLGTAMLARGVGQVITQGAQRNTSLPEIFGVVGNASIPGTPIKVTLLIMALIVIIAVIIEKTTVFGRRTFLIGANREAARLSGVKDRRHLTFLFLTSAFLAGVAGILMASEFKAGISNRATGFEFDALVIALLGGTSINGGFGSVLGTVVGALVLAVVTSAATGMVLSPDWQFVLKGVVTFLAILAQRYALDKRNG